jgi:hypothetical protein
MWKNDFNNFWIFMSGFLLCFFSFCPAQENIVFPQRPRFVYTASEMEDVKKNQTKNVEIQNIIKQADTILNESLEVPVKEGDWIFYYFCPKDDAMLKPETETRHICSVCGSVYTDERTSAAYRTYINYKIDRNCLILARAYAFTGDIKYAERVRQVLLTLASVYPGFERHDRWGRKGILAVVGGKRYAQNLDEAVSAIDLASAYDLVANASCFSDEDRKISEKLLQDIAKEILRFQSFSGGKNNHQTWFNAAYTVVGLVTGDEHLMKEGIYGRYGLLWQVENSITADGLWYEGTIAYHFYALSAIQYTLDAAKRVGWDFSKNERLKSMWFGPVNLSYPDGRLPAFNDSDPVDLKNYSQFYLWAYKYFNDQIFSIYAGQSISAGQSERKSMNMKDIGIAVLRRMSSSGPVCAMLDYGIHGDSHGHPDKLNIVFYAFGRELLIDSGRISYSVPEYKTWCRTTIAHNTVVIDEKDQQPATGRLLYFNETKDFSACLAVCDCAYPSYDIKRFLVLFDNIMVDVFVVEGKEKKQMDWIIHCRGSIVQDKNQKPCEFLADHNGYQHLKNIQMADEISEPQVYNFVQEDKRSLRVFLLNNKNSSIFTGTSIGYNLKDSAAFLLRRRFASKTVFITVYDFSPFEDNRIQKIQVLPVFSRNKKIVETDAIGLRIIKPEEFITIGLDMREKITDKPTINNQKFQRMFYSTGRSKK